MKTAYGTGDFFNELAKLDEYHFFEKVQSEGLPLPVLHNAGKISYEFLKLTEDFVAALTQCSRGRYVFDPDFKARPYQVCNQSKGRVGRKQLYLRFDATPFDHPGCSEMAVSMGLGFDFRNNQGIHAKCVDDYEKFHKKLCDDPVLFDDIIAQLGGYAEPYKQFEGTVTAMDARQRTPGILQPWLFFGRRITFNTILAMATLEDWVAECIKVFDIICMAGYYHTYKQRNYRNELYPSFTLESYFIGDMNMQAVSAATRVAKVTDESRRMNPLIIGGKNGLGKTHLLQAIANKICIDQPHSEICYIAAQRYLSDIMYAFQTERLDEFTRYYHSVDVLLIDDFHLLAGEVNALEWLLTILKILIDSRKQIILTSEVPLSEMEWLEPQLISLLKTGLTVTISHPDLNTRADILLYKSASFKNPISGVVAFFIAEQVNRTLTPKTVILFISNPI